MGCGPSSLSYQHTPRHSIPAFEAPIIDLDQLRRIGRIGSQFPGETIAAYQVGSTGRSAACEENLVAILKRDGRKGAAPLVVMPLILAPSHYGPVSLPHECHGVINTGRHERITQPNPVGIVLMLKMI